MANYHQQMQAIFEAYQEEVSRDPANAMAIALLETVSHLLSKEAIPDDPPAVDEGSE